MWMIITPTPVETNKPALVAEQLKDDSNIIFKQINDNALKANPDKFHLLLYSNDDEIYNDIDNHRIYTVRQYIMTLY